MNATKLKFKTILTDKNNNSHVIFTDSNNKFFVVFYRQSNNIKNSINYLESNFLGNDVNGCFSFFEKIMNQMGLVICNFIIDIDEEKNNKYICTLDSCLETNASFLFRKSEEIDFDTLLLSSLYFQKNVFMTEFAIKEIQKYQYEDLEKYINNFSK